MFVGEIVASDQLGDVVMLAKSDSRFRPITVLRLLYKLVAGTVMGRTLQLLANHARLEDTAYGFRIDGTVEAPVDIIVKLQEHALGTHSEQHRLDMDMTSAYDTGQWPMLDVALRMLGLCLKYTLTGNEQC